MSEVLQQLLEHHPDLHKIAELDRSWVWLPINLSGEANKAVREAIGRKGIGFSFAPRGHVLPSGRIGFWAHHCSAPRPFKRKGKGAASSAKQPASSHQPQRLDPLATYSPATLNHERLQELAAAFD